MRRARTLPSPAVVIASAALLAALAGTSVAAVTVLPRNSVGTAQLKSGAVTSAKVRNGSLLRADFKPGQIPAGPRGPQGQPGPQGPPGLSGLERREESTPLNSVGTRTLVAVCPAGKRAIGGGARVNGSGAQFVTVNESWPDSLGDRWNVVARESTATPLTWALAAFALCATVSG